MKALHAAGIAAGSLAAVLAGLFAWGALRSKGPKPVVVAKAGQAGIPQNIIAQIPGTSQLGTDVLAGSAAFANVAGAIKALGLGGTSTAPSDAPTAPAAVDPAETFTPVNDGTELPSLETDPNFLT